jgi:hypothetical protein
MKRLSLSQKVYCALFEISSLREQVRSLASEAGPVAEERFMRRLGVLEVEAERLIDEIERRGSPPHAH